MIKNVKYRGMTTSPSDYECPDGELAIGHNLAIDDSELRPVRLPSVVTAVASGTDAMYVHQTEKYRHFIGKTKKAGLIDNIAISYGSGSLVARCGLPPASALTVSLYKIERFAPISGGDVIELKRRVNYTIPAGTESLVLEQTVDATAEYELISFTPGADSTYTYKVSVESLPVNSIVTTWDSASRKITFHLKYPAASNVGVVVYYMGRAYEHIIPVGAREHTYDQPNGVTRVVLDGDTYSDSSYTYSVAPEAAQSMEDVDWYYDKERYWLCWFTQDEADPVYIQSWVDDFTAVSSIGNILMVTTDESIEYFLWVEEKGMYKYLGKHLPEAKIRFTSSMYFTGDGEVERNANPAVIARPQVAYDASAWVESGLSVEDLPTSTERTKWVTDGNADTDKKSSRLTTAAMGQLSMLLENARKEGLFVHPRLLRFAYRLYDGSYVQMSSPILIYNGSTREAVGGIPSNVKICASVARYYLDYYIQNLEEIMEWAEIVKGITFFLSSEIYDFDQNGRIERLVYEADSGSFPATFHAVLPEIAEGTKAERIADTYTFYKAYDISLEDYHSGYALMYLYSSGVTGTDVDKVGKLNEGTLSVTLGIDGVSRTATVPVAQYSTLKDIEDGLTYAFHRWGVTAHVLHRNRGCTPAMVMERKDPKEILCAIAFVSSEKPTGWGGATWTSQTSDLCDLNVYGSTVYGMPMLPDRLPLATLETGYSVSDDYLSHNVIRPGAMYGYNSRQVFGDIRMYYYHPIFSGLYGYQNTASRLILNPPLEYTVQAMWFYLRIGGQEVVVRSDIQGQTPVTYVYYPDTRCYKAVVKVLDEDGQTRYAVLPMKASDHLNGSVFIDSVPYLSMRQISSNILWDGTLAGADIISYADDTITEDPEESYGYEQLPSTVMNSEVNNPFNFRAAGFSTAGHTRILGLASATMAMSQGQFGQFPVYAFCEDGVYSLNVSSAGYFESVTPASRDVCISADSICQTDNSVIFATDRGVMVISGSTAACMSEALDGYCFDITLLPAYDEMLWDAGLDGERFRLTDIRTYVHGCFVMYDYRLQHIVIANPSYPYCYLYSIKSKSWTTMDNTFSKRLNSYPQTLAVDTKGRIVSISEPSDEVAKGLLITRPLKMDAPDSYKTVYAVRQRGTISYTDLSTVLWASNDMERWYLLRSSATSVLRGFGGTPYKYLIVGVVSEMERTRLLTSFSVTMSLKYDDKMR